MTIRDERLQLEEHVLEAIEFAQNASHVGVVPKLKALEDRMLDIFVKEYRQGQVNERDEWWHDTFFEMLSLVYFYLALAEIKHENFKPVQEYAWRAAEIKPYADETYLDACNNLYLHGLYSYTDEGGNSIGWTSMNLVDQFLEKARTFEDMVHIVVEYHTPFDPAQGADVVYRVVTKMSYEHEKYSDYVSFDDALSFCKRMRDGFHNPPYIPELPEHLQPDMYYVEQEELEGKKYFCKMKSYTHKDETISIKIVEVSPKDAKYW